MTHRQINLGRDTPPGPAPGASPAVTGGGGVHSPASSGGQGNQPTLPRRSLIGAFLGWVNAASAS